MTVKFESKRGLEIKERMQRAEKLTKGTGHQMGGSFLKPVFQDFCNKALTKEEKLEHWSISNIIPQPQKGDISDPKKYRGITSLYSLIAKTFNKTILNRLKAEAEKVLKVNHNGFRPGRSTAQQILVLM